MQSKKYYSIGKIFGTNGKILLFLFCFIYSGLKSQDVYTTVALTAADNTGYGYYTFSKPGLYLAVGKSQEVDYFKEGRLNYGIALSQKGARKAANPTVNDYVDYNVRLNYAELNMAYWLKFKSLKAIVGLNGGYLFNMTEKSVYGSPVLNTAHPYKKLDFSFTAGAGVMAGKKFLLQLTGSYSILPVKNIGGIGTVAFSRGPRNTLVNIGFTYLFIKKPQPEEIPEEE